MVLMFVAHVMCDWLIECCMTDTMLRKHNALIYVQLRLAVPVVVISQRVTRIMRSNYNFFGHPYKTCNLLCMHSYAHSHT